MKTTMIRSVLLVITALLTLILLISCSGGKTNSDVTTGEEEQTGDQTGTTAGPDDPGDPGKAPEAEPDYQRNVSELKETVPASEPADITAEGYDAKSSGESWSINSGVDFTVYNFSGSGNALIKNVEKKYPKAKVTYYKYDITTDKKKTMKLSEVAQLSSALAFYKGDKKTLSVYIQTIDPRVQIEWSSATLRSGYYVMIPFRSNVPGEYSAFISTKKGANSGNISFTGMSASGKKGEYSGSIHFTVPFTDPGDYWLNLVANRECVASIPIKISESKYSSYEYHVVFEGAWDMITAPGYQDELFKLFYNTYPRLNKRWGIGTENKTVRFIADPDYDGVAYSMGDMVVVATDYANGNPHDIGFFSHEITHQVQAYSDMDSDWWIENMATYGGFRYFHWCNANYVQVYSIKEDRSLWDFDKWDPYEGNGCKLFFSYMDSKWPTTKDEDGNLVYGLIDAINFGIKNGKIRDDDPTRNNTAFNRTVKEITGLDDMKAVRDQYSEECKNGTWDFTGFGEYVDNWITEDIPNCENPVYPKMSDPVHGEKTADALANAVTDGENLALGGSIIDCSGFVNGSEAPEKLIDGKLNTKWCCTDASDPTYCLDGARFWVIIDLGEKKTFNTYTIFNTKTQETGGNMSEWELYISDDPYDTEGWVSVDYQKMTARDYQSNKPGYNTMSFDIGDISARYLLLKVYNGDGSRGTVRLYELQLYNLVRNG